MGKESEPSTASIPPHQGEPKTVVNVWWGFPPSLNVTETEWVEYLRSLGEKDPSGGRFVAFWAKKRVDGLADRARHLVRI